MEQKDYQQLSLFPESGSSELSSSENDSSESLNPDPRPPVSITWNLWHGCKKISPGCANCYMFRRDEEYGKDPTSVHKTAGFNLPIRHKSITHEPMLEAINIRKYLEKFADDRNPDGSRILDSVSCGGESGSKARVCDYAWVVNTHVQCVEYGVPFHYHQTGAKLRRSVSDGKGGLVPKIFEIPREHQHDQARKAGLDYGGGVEMPECLSECSRES